ncbi:MAG TPA: MotA/TolQ/ExbB proton channel family protein [Thermodesulfovibrionales bacterium]|nr:MotA/TolQ/ExbB proton channel family protein [Thermodesulfovibrionales bacterium]
MKDSALQLILQAGYIVKGVLILLLFFSIVSWAIIFFKHRYFSRAHKETDQFLRAYRSGRDPKGIYQVTKAFIISPIANVFRAVYTDETHKAKGEIKRLLKRYEALESAKLERYLNFLATTGSTTPFIGLFGTVWGIMNSFRNIGASGAASLAVVAPGIAESLIATAAGLVAAIPAVIAYNYYLSVARRMIIEMEDFSEELLDFFTKEHHES